MHEKAEMLTVYPWAFLFVIVGSREPPYTTEVHGFFMLDLVRNESFRLDSRFLEPACGDGNFLIEILRRKLFLLRDIKSLTDWEFKSLIAVGSCYGIDILPDNTEACRKRLEEHVLSQHPALKTHRAQGEVDITKIVGSSLMEVAASDSAASERLNARSAINTIQAEGAVWWKTIRVMVISERCNNCTHLTGCTLSMSCIRPAALCKILIQYSAK